MAKFSLDDMDSIFEAMTDKKTSKSSMAKTEASAKSTKTSLKSSRCSSSTQRPVLSSVAVSPTVSCTIGRSFVSTASRNRTSVKTPNTSLVKKRNGIANLRNIRPELFDQNGVRIEVPAATLLHVQICALNKASQQPIKRERKYVENQELEEKVKQVLQLWENADVEQVRFALQEHSVDDVLNNAMVDKFECTACMSEYFAVESLQKTCVGGAECHSFCSECVIAYAKAKLEEQSVAAGGLGLACMGQQCKGIIPRQIIEHAIKVYADEPKKLLLLLENCLREQNFADSKIPIEYCVRCGYGCLFDVSSDVDPTFCCWKCKSVTCRLCHKTWDNLHEGRKCADALSPEDVERIDLKVWLMSKKDKEPVFRKAWNVFGKQLEGGLSNQTMARCAGCNVAIEKEEKTCNKVRCTKCKAITCYVCLQSIADSYAHFCGCNGRKGLGEDCACKKPCPLWADMAEIRKARRNQLLAQSNANKAIKQLLK